MMRPRPGRWLAFPLALLGAVALPLILPSRAPHAAEVAPTPPAPPPAEPTAAPIFLNVKVLTDVTSKQEMRQRMRTIAASLGVRCSFCHVAGAADKDDKEEKRKAREMMRMVKHINETWLTDVEHFPAVTCWTCHRGEKEPARVVPADAYPALDIMEPAGENK